MPLCGFNKKMLEGLTALTEGLVEHGLEYRCEKNDETINQGIKRELSDMSRLILELNNIDDSAKRIMTEGIVKYAQGFYIHMWKKGIRNYKKDIQKIMSYFEFMDSTYYGELENTQEDMKDLTNLLDKKEI